MTEEEKAILESFRPVKPDMRVMTPEQEEFLKYRFLPVIEDTLYELRVLKAGDDFDEFDAYVYGEYEDKDKRIEELINTLYAVMENNIEELGKFIRSLRCVDEVNKPIGAYPFPERFYENHFPED